MAAGDPGQERSVEQPVEEGEGGHVRHGHAHAPGRDEEQRNVEDRDAGDDDKGDATGDEGKDRGRAQLGRPRSAPDSGTAASAPTPAASIKRPTPALPACSNRREAITARAIHIPRTKVRSPLTTRRPPT